MLDKYICTIAVNMMPKLNRVSLLPLWERIGGFENLESPTENEWNELCLEYGVHPREADREKAIKRAINEASLMEKYGISLLSYEDYNYPLLLLECPDAPLVLYYKGTLFCEKEHFAIVGTRMASRECKEIITEIVSEVSKCYEEPVIVSGLAHGIDICAQKAAIEYGLKSYAILAHGLGMIYPAANRDFAKSIIESGKGAIISEYPSNTQPQKFYFLERNRIVAGISRWLLVGESGLKGGSMVTAKIAFSYGREIMSVPGSPRNPYAQGCNQLIKHNMATLVENGNDVIENMGLRRQNEKSKTIEKRYIAQTIDEELILDTLKRQREAININEISRITGIGSDKLPLLLLNLEMNSLIYALPGENYRICK